MYREEIYKMLKTLQGEHIFKKKKSGAQTELCQNLFLHARNMVSAGLCAGEKGTLGDEDGAQPLCTNSRHQDFLYFLF